MHHEHISGSLSATDKTRSVMKRTIIRIAVVTALLVTAFSVSPAVAAQAGPDVHDPTAMKAVASARNAGVLACNIKGPDRDLARPIMQQPVANVRTGPSTSCDVAGLIYQGYRLNYNCYAWGEDPGTGWPTWTYLLYVYQDTWYAGWVNDGLLPNHGSSVLC
jgi:hypothetical protein